MVRRPDRRLTHYWILAAGLTLTVLATYGLHRNIVENDRARFINAVEATQDLIEKRIDVYTATLVATRGQFRARYPVTVESFHQYVLGLELERYPGIQGIGFTQRVTPDELSELKREASNAGQRDFRVWPSGQRAEYHPIVFLEPMDRRNRAAIGYDMFSELVRREAMMRARDSGRPAVSRKVTLVQEIDPFKQAGFLICVPVYSGLEPETLEERRRTLQGFVYAPFRAGDLFRGIFGRQRQPRVSFEVYDGAKVSEPALMYRTGVVSHEPRFERVERLDIAGNTWSIVFKSELSFEAASSRPFVPTVFGIGLLISSILFLVMSSQLRARAAAEASDAAARRAQQRAETLKSEAEAQRNNLRALFMQAPAAVAIVRGPDFRYELSNPMNQELAGRRALVGRSVMEALPEMEAQGLFDLLKHVYETGEPFVGNEVPVMIRTADGGQRQAYMNGTYQPLRGADGSVEGVMVFAYEVTDQVVARQKMEALNQNLQALTDDLKRAIRVRDDFLSIAGHELKTPLAALTLQIQGLERQVQKGSFGPPPSRLTERLQKATAQVGRLERLVNELLDVSKIASGRLALQLEEVDLSGLIADVVERFVEQASRAGCKVDLICSEQVVGRWDRVRLDQVVTNLISNAIKYGAGQPIEVTVGAAGSVAKLTVRDHGIGIAAQDRERIFGRFERAVSERNYGGLGLGLWISRQIVESLGGRIYLDDVPGDGSAFSVELPFDPAHLIRASA